MLSTAYRTDARPQGRSATARTRPPPVGEGGALRLPWRGGRSLGTWTARPDRRGALPAADGVRARGGRDRQVARSGAGASDPDRAGAGPSPRSAGRRALLPLVPVQLGPRHPARPARSAPAAGARPLRLDRSRGGRAAHRVGVGPRARKSTRLNYS